MPRPKGSKNKKSLQTVAQLEEKLAKQMGAKKALEAEQAAILAAMEQQKQLLKAKKKEIRAAEKAILALEEKKAEAEAVQTAVAKKMEIEQVVAQLITSGKDAEEILDMLQK